MQVRLTSDYFAPSIILQTNGSIVCNLLLKYASHKRLFTFKYFLTIGLFRAKVI
jgi:hypothetical protein